MKAALMAWGLVLCLAAGAAAGGVDDVRAGLKAFGQGNYDQAILLMGRGLDSGELTPEQRFAALVNRGAAYERKKNLDAALADFNRAVALQPGNAQAHAARGSIHAAMGFHDDAIEDFTRALQLKPDWAEGHFGLGATFGAKGDRESARDHLRRAVELDPNHKKARFLLSEIERRR